jgi:linoleoyl-CoA desaturase
MHIMTGNLSHQIEHHLFPDMPSNRYAEVAPRVRELCERYGLPYTSGPLYKQYAGVLATIARLALPGGGTNDGPAQVAIPEQADRRSPRSGLRLVTDGTA